MYKNLQRTCTAIVLLIKPFVWGPSRRHYHRGLLKFLNGKLTAQPDLNSTVRLIATARKHQRREDEEPTHNLYGTMYAYYSAQHDMWKSLFLCD